jgi:predicted phage-related endonuclease
MDSKYLGTKALTTKLTKVFFEHIRKQLPDVFEEIKAKIKECEDRIKELGPPMPNKTQEKLHLIWSMITEYCENFQSFIKGKYDKKRAL